MLSSEILHINVEIDACLDGQRWQWDGIEFQMLNPSHTKIFNRSDYSCVLKVTAGGKSVLMTGDIGQAAEARLLREHGDDLKSEIMVMPHHGSMTSSTRYFVKIVAPEFALFSVGYRNRYGFPKKKVVNRYRDQGQDSQMLETAYQGAIRFDLKGNSPLIPLSYRHSKHRYWDYRD